MASVQQLHGDQLGHQQQANDRAGPQLRKSCDYCVRMKRGCDGGTPCGLCRRRNKQCIRSVKKRSGPAKGAKYCKRRARKPSKAAAGPSRPAGGAFAVPPPPPPSASCASSKKAVDAATCRGSPAVPVAAAFGASCAVATRRPLSGCEPPDIKKRDARVRFTPSASTPIPHVKQEIPATRPFTSAVIAPDRTLATAFSSPPCLSTMASVHPKLERVEESPAAVATAAAAAVEASQARWRELRLEQAVAGGRGSTADMRGVSLENDACNGSFPPYFYQQDGTAASGYASVSGDVGATSAGFATGGSVGEDAVQAARVAGSRRTSLEESLYGACYKRASLNAWPQTLDVGGRDLVGYLWNHRSQGAGAEDAGATALSYGRPSEPSHSQGPTTLYRTSPIMGMGTADYHNSAPPRPSMQSDPGLSTHTPSLRDLLLDKWPPAPVAELSILESM